VLLGYGDDSIAELGGAHIACERISNIAAKALEDSRIGISPLEKSTRYVRFDIKDEHGKYLYYREPTICSSKFSGLYEETLDNLFDTYSRLITPLSDYLKTQNSQDDSTSDRAYNTAIKAKALDLLRGLLPMATLTNVGLYGNGRAFEYLIVKLNGSRVSEVRTLGKSMFNELSRIIPSFIKKACTERGIAQSDRLCDIQMNARTLAVGTLNPYWNTGESKIVKLIDYDISTLDKIVTAILYPYSTLSLTCIKDQVADLLPNQKEKIIKTYFGDRQSRFDKVGRAFEEVYYTFDILSDIGAYRDLQRHRILSQDHQEYTTQHGYDVPRELIDAGLDNKYKDALDKANESFKEISAFLPVAAQYMVPFAYKIRWKIKLNLREAFHFIELRSGRQGHPSYRKIAQEMYLAIQSKHPLLAKYIMVDINNYELERLAAEQKLDAKSKL
jgi:thymidylate synthase ThyX